MKRALELQPHGRSNLACGSQPKCYRPTISKRRNLGTGGHWAALQSDPLKNGDDGEARPGCLGPFLALRFRPHGIATD